MPHRHLSTASFPGELFVAGRDGVRYDGQWSDGVAEGRGVATYSRDGQRYEGMWKAGKRDGRGNISWPNGAAYEGRFRDGAIDGQGTLQVTQRVVIQCRVRRDGRMRGAMVCVAMHCYALLCTVLRALCTVMQVSRNAPLVCVRRIT